MKSITRFLTPLFVLAVLAVSVVGVAFAREASEFEGSRANRSGEMEFTGTIDAMGAGAWTISGRAVAVSASTEVKGLLSVGQTVKVPAFVAADGTLTAREIEAAGVSVGDDNSNQAGDDNSNEAGDDNSNQAGDVNSNEIGDDDSNQAGDDNSNDDHGGHGRGGDDGPGDDHGGDRKGGGN
jgi:hypothetical protein